MNKDWTIAFKDVTWPSPDNITTRPYSNYKTYNHHYIYVVLASTFPNQCWQMLTLDLPSTTLHNTLLPQPPSSMMPTNAPSQCSPMATTAHNDHGTPQHNNNAAMPHHQPNEHWWGQHNTTSIIWWWWCGTSSPSGCFWPPQWVNNHLAPPVLTIQVPCCCGDTNDGEGPPPPPMNGDKDPPPPCTNSDERPAPAHTWHSQDRDKDDTAQWQMMMRLPHNATTLMLNDNTCWCEMRTRPGHMRRQWWGPRTTHEWQWGSPPCNVPLPSPSPFPSPSPSL